jgi:hypothetical protein
VTERSGYFLIGLLVALIGVGFFIWGGVIYAKAGASDAWPSTEGVVIASEVERSVNVQSRDRRHKYTAKVEYRYAVAERDYTSRRIDFSSVTVSHKNSGRAMQVVNRYPTGKRVQVYYDPGNPDFAVLERGVKTSTYLGFVIGTFLIGVGAFLVVRSRSM